MNLPIITYHGIENGTSPLFTPPMVFEAQLTALAENGYQSVALADVVDWLKGAKSLPEKSVAITIDDGYASVYDKAWPLLRAHGYLATVFLVTGYCGGSNRWPSQQEEVPVRPLLTWKQIESLAKDGWEFSAHTKSHPPLPLLSSLEIEEEIRSAKEAISQRLDHQARVFAYPYGAASSNVVTIVKRYFDGAVGVNLGMVTAGSDIYYLERIDSYYLTPRLIPIMDRQIFRQYLGLRQRMRIFRRRYRTDWDPSFAS